MKYKMILLILIGSLLIGCKTTPVTNIVIDESLLVKCNNLSKLPDRLTMGELVLDSLELTEQYRICQERHNGLVDVVRRVQDR